MRAVFIYKLYGFDSSSLIFSRFEEIEIDKKVSAGKKHPRESDATEADVSLSGSAKKANKKLKSDGGSAAAAPLSTDANGESKPESNKEKKKKKRDKKKDKGEGKSDVEGGDDAKPSVSSQVKELSGGLKIKDVKVGNGKQAKAGNTVSMRYAELRFCRLWSHSCIILDTSANYPTGKSSILTPKENRCVCAACGNPFL